MINFKLKYMALCLIGIATACHTDTKKGESVKERNKVSTAEASWMIGPFERPQNAQPIIQRDTMATFNDPMSGQEVVWQSMATFNPAAIVKDGKINVLYRDNWSLRAGHHRSGRKHCALFRILLRVLTPRRSRR